jgi:hypothetical protein
MLSLADLYYILGRTSTPYGTFRAGDDGPAFFWLQFVMRAPDATRAEADCAEWRGRKWRVSKYSTEREVVGTAFAALLTALEHEARESFRWRTLRTSERERAALPSSSSGICA